MKKIILMFLAVFCISPNLLAAYATESDALHALDTICADTWCEGAEFSFRTVICSREKYSCKVLFTMDERVASCVIPGFQSYDAMLDSYRELDSTFYEHMTNCIWAI